jgi:hypothetical protein
MERYQNNDIVAASVHGIRLYMAFNVATPMYVGNGQTHSYSDKPVRTNA